MTAPKKIWFIRHASSGSDTGQPTSGPENIAITSAGEEQAAELAERYARRTGRDLSRLDYYVGFNRWKSAAIVHGVYARYCEGKKSTEGVNMPGLRLAVDQYLMMSEQAVERLERRVA